MAVVMVVKSEKNNSLSNDRLKPPDVANRCLEATDERDRAFWKSNVP